ncbi:MAG: UDP-N-acetylmuramate:L-alanyl-gamma-D-glutamyl-meso-diaminopimelate ligase [Desulfocapsaceae bacterium]|nr:UDP-N-acetylmuramate:L-alanyl-gamma-D-glutamyl-meso-diaminopimelate ligase [Desulfocapsaceae bacterium]
MSSAELDRTLNTAPENVHTIHIMGICGTGMAALAGMLHQSGYRVTGSDNHIYPPMSDFLRRIGIPIKDGYCAANLSPPPDLVIVGNVITRKNPEAAALAESRIPYLSFPQALSRYFIDRKTSLVVAGTHGKTTTCSLLAATLHHAGLDPSFMIGGIVQEFQGNFRIGQGSHFISEGDEYDTAFFDKESKFLHYRPDIAIITSVEFDHADIFADIEQIKRSFKKFVALLPPQGLIVANLDDRNVAEVVADAPCPVQGYGMRHDLDWTLSDVTFQDGKSHFSIRHLGRQWAEMTVNLSGRHNCLNSLAVAAVLNHIGVDPQVIEGGLSVFKGVKRRQEVRGVEKGITVIDDFAHHPTAVRETLAGLKEAYSGRRLIAVFEPRTNSSRRTIFQNDYAGAFGSADIILIRNPLPMDNIPAREHFSAEKLAGDLRDRNQTARSFPSTPEILDYLQIHLKEGDVVAILSNGGFDNIHSQLLEILKSR